MRSAASCVLPVIENGRLLGTVSDWDLAVKGCGAGLDPRAVTVSEVVNRDPPICRTDMKLKSVLALTRAHHQTWSIVLDNRGTVAGVVSLVGLLALLETLVPYESTGPEPEYVRRVRGVSIDE